MYGMNANYDATANSHGVPLTTRNPTHEDDIEAAVNNDTTKTEATSMTEGHNDEKRESPANSLGKEQEEDDSVEAEMVRRSSVVQALARSYSRTSAGAVPGQNPFLAEENSPLNPNSPNFSGREWAKAVVELVSQDGKSFRSSGVCFQNLNVHGFGAATDYQKDVANVWLSAAGVARQLTGSGKQRIDILRNFDGLVRKGEMLVVLGPPGSGCSTFLKTIAGETNGIFVQDDSYFNYQGEQKPIALHQMFKSRNLTGGGLLARRNLPSMLGETHGFGSATVSHPSRNNVGIMAGVFQMWNMTAEDAVSAQPPRITLSTLP